MYPKARRVKRSPRTKHCIHRYDKFLLNCVSPAGWLTLNQSLPGSEISEIASSHIQVPSSLKKSIYINTKRQRCQPSIAFCYYYIESSNTDFHKSQKLLFMTNEQEEGYTLFQVRCNSKIIDSSKCNSFRLCNFT